MKTVFTFVVFRVHSWVSTSYDQTHHGAWAFSP